MRASVVMGFVGAGGLGQLMDQSMKMLNGGEASTILLTFLALVIVADALSAVIRRVLCMSVIETRRRPAAGAPRAVLGLHGALTLGVVAAVVASFAYLAVDYRQLVSDESLRLMAKFVREFFPPDLTPPFLAKAAWGALQTFAVAAIGTLLAVVVRRAAGAAGGGTLRRSRRAWPRVSLLNFLRSVPSSSGRR